MNQAPKPAPRSAVRLIFEYDGDNVRLISRQPVDVILPPTALAAEGVPGHYVEVRDQAGRALSRVPVHGAFEGSAEVFPEQPGEPIMRVDAPRRGAFTVVVPASQQASEAALLEVRPTTAEAAPGSTLAGRDLEVVEIAKFRIAPVTEGQP